MKRSKLRISLTDVLVLCACLNPLPVKAFRKWLKVWKLKKRICGWEVFHCRSLTMQDTFVSSIQKLGQITQMTVG